MRVRAGRGPGLSSLWLATPHTFRNSPPKANKSRWFYHNAETASERPLEQMGPGTDSGAPPAGEGAAGAAAGCPEGAWAVMGASAAGSWAAPSHTDVTGSTAAPLHDPPNHPRRLAVRRGADTTPTQPTQTTSSGPAGRSSTTQVPRASERLTPAPTTGRPAFRRPVSLPCLLGPPCHLAVPQPPRDSAGQPPPTCPPRELQALGHAQTFCQPGHPVLPASPRLPPGDTGCPDCLPRPGSRQGPVSDVHAPKPLLRP